MKNIFAFKKQKEKKEKISMITCYDYSSARMIAETNIDCVLVGDSLAMTMHGFENTISATVPMMAMHTAAVARGLNNKFIITDLPFLSYRLSQAKTMQAAQTLMQAGAQALKLEGAMGNEKIIQYLVESGVPIMGHIGLTAQLLHTMGGYKIQGKTAESANRLREEAKRLEDAGCFAVVLECVPTTLAQEITDMLSIPTIGIGAGAGTDGQVLVWQDLLGFNIDFKPKFVKQYFKGYDAVVSALNTYNAQIKAGEFPDDEHSFECE